MTMVVCCVAQEASESHREYIDEESNLKLVHHTVSTLTEESNLKLILI